MRTDFAPSSGSSRDRGDWCSDELLLVRDAYQHAVHFSDEVGPEAIALRFVPGRRFFEFRERSS